MKPEYDFLIVGAGLFGATFAHIAHQAGRRCIVIERRPYIGGNTYCKTINSINVHVHGAHIFHTSDRQVWELVTSLTDFNRFTNSPIARYGDEQYNLPFNMNTFHQLWGVTSPEQAAAIIEQQRAQAIDRMKADGVTEPRNLEEQALILVGSDIYTKLICGYTRKQWGRECSKLPAFLIRRLPVRFSYDNNYFTDRYQGIPIGGYNHLTRALLDGVEVLTGVDFFDNPQQWRSRASTTVFTGMIDRFFDYRYGKLQYRSLRYEHQLLENVPNYQGNAVVNYTDYTTPFTRIIEHKHFEAFGDDVYNNPSTVISREYPVEWESGMEPYYPINDEANSRIYAEYRRMALQQQGVIFGGRLAEYRYYDMAPVMRRAIDEASKAIQK